MNDHIQVNGLSFRPFITAQELRNRIAVLGQLISDDYRDKRPLFLAVLNGAFLFAADLIRECQIDCEISFIRLASYDGLSSTGQVKTVIGLQEDIRNRHIIIVEDIVDTGKTLFDFIPQLQQLEPASVAVAALLTKPEALQYELDVPYMGFAIPDKFVVGYGLDYNGLGRNFPGIYQLVE